jgi:hypothetical protein
MRGVDPAARDILIAGEQVGVMAEAADRANRARNMLRHQEQAAG